MGPIAGRVLLLDIAALHGGPLGDGTPITADDLRQAADRAGADPQTGDIVLIRTGWGEHQALAPDVSFDAEPGLDLEAALWLAERNVAAVGADNYAVEVLPFEAGTVFPVHQRLIRDFGIPLLEGLDLRHLSATGRGTFLFAANPLPLAGGTGSPISPMAIL
jgi:kynurenine formamidase